MVRKRPRIPRTHSKAGATCGECRFQVDSFKANRESLNRHNPQMTLKPGPPSGRFKVISSIVITMNLEFNSVPKEETFPIPLIYIDVTRSTHTDLDVMQEKSVDDYRNVDSNT